MPRNLTGDRGTDAIMDSLSELDGRAAVLKSQREAEMHELVLHLSEIKGGRATAVLSGISLTGGSEGDRAAAVLEHTAFCREYLAAFPGRTDYKKSIFFGSEDFISSKKSIGYVKNEFSSRALNIFSGFLPGYMSEASHGYDAMCEDIYSGQLEYGIIPLCNMNDGRLPVFYGLINRYELKIVSVCRVVSSESGSTLFALIGKSIAYPDTRFGKQTCLELFVTIGSGHSLTEMLCAAEACGMELLRLDSFGGFSSVGEGTAFSPVFSISGADTETFLLYMTADFPQYTPVGIYSIVE